MRIPSLSQVVRTFYALSNSTLSFTYAARPRILSPGAAAPPPLRASMPTVPFLGALFGSKAASQNMASSSYPVQKSASEWEAVLSPEQFRVLREQGTEAPHTGTYDKHMPAAGVYACAGCSAPLYKASHKFASGCGWPAYFDSLPGAVERRPDRSLGLMPRTEIVCANCGGHLGHVFKGEGYKTPTDERHCVNSVSLRFSEDEGASKA